ncbi:MAG: hypothetical protein ACT4QF_09400 [Sporichthyaceae bacterium]
MTKLRKFSTGVCVLALCAVPSTAVAVESAPGASGRAITSDTTLKMGKKGLLELVNYAVRSGEKNRRVPVNVRVVKIEKGKASDLKGKGLPASTTGMVPWYIRSELSYAGGDFDSLFPSFRGGFSDGSTATDLFTNKKIGSCKEASSAKLNKKQRTALNCQVVLAPAGVPVDRAFTYHSATENRSVTVTWKK